MNLFESPYDLYNTIPGFVLDFKSIYSQWKKVDCLKFVDFKAIWKELEMSLIFEGKSNSMTQKGYMHMLYGSNFTYLYVDDFRIQVGAIYGTYLLHECQPHSPQIPISISIELWRLIVSIVEKAKENQILDVLAIWNKLRKDNSLCFYGCVKLIPTPNHFPTKESEKSNLAKELLHADTLSGVIDINSLQEMDNLYHQAKLKRIEKTESNSMSVINMNLVEDVKKIISENSRFSSQKLQQQHHEQQLALQEQLRLDQTGQPPSQNNTNENNNNNDNILEDFGNILENVNQNQEETFIDSDIFFTNNE